MRSMIVRKIYWMIVLFCSAYFTSITPLSADENYDPEVILQIPNQNILNNETLPGTAGNTGSMRHAIPIKVAPGRNGLQPELSLNYNSSNKQNSWMGVGWSLDIGSIQRSNKRRINFDASDAFTWNESVELVPRTQWGSGWYGARIEGEFTKFRFVSETSGWEVLTPDGRTSYYGTSANSRIQAGEGVFKWLLDEVVDANGNRMTIEYDHRGTDGIYPERISYSPSGSRIDFITESRTDVYPVYSCHTEISLTRRLREIQCYGSGSLAHRYVLGYDYSDYSDRLLLASVQEYGSSSSTTLPATTFSYQSGDTVGFNSSARSISSNIINQMGTTFFADINGDGFNDLIKFDSALSMTRLEVRLWNNGNNNFGSARTTELEDAADRGGILFGDINGDGRTDCVVAHLGPSLTARAYLGEPDGDLAYVGQVLTLNANTGSGLVQLADSDNDGFPDLIEFTMSGAVYVHKADGAGRFSTTTTNSNLCNSNDPGRVLMADVNGDGLADVIQTMAMTYNVYVHLADGAGRFDSCISTQLGYSTAPGNLNFADVNGDGLSDIVLSPSGNTYVYTYLSRGDGHFEAAVATNTNNLNYNGYNHLGDVNGDGFDDLIKCNQIGTDVRTYLSDGPGSFTYLNQISTNNQGYATLVDVNGDGLADLIKSESLNQYTYTYLSHGIASSGIRPDLLTQINNGYNVISIIAYQLSTATPGIHKSSTYTSAYLPFVADLATSITVNDGIGNSAIRTSYTYNDARYSNREKEFLGLGRIVQTNPNATTLTTTYNVDNYYLKGRPAESLYDDNNSADYLCTNYTWESTTLEGLAEGAAIWVRPERQETDLRSGGTVVQSDIDFNYEYDPDRFGYLSETVQSGTGASNLTTRTTYDRYATWILRLEDKRILQGSATARHITYGYDSRGNCTSETYENNDGANAIINRFFDGYGNIDWEDDPNGNRTDFTYTVDNTYVGSKNFEGLTTNFYDYNQWGKPGRIEDENGGNTYYGYDVYGRTTQEDYPGPGSKGTTYYDTARPRYSITTINGGTTTYDYIDGLDRPLQTTASAADNRQIATRLYYDAAGRNHLTIGPFFRSDFSYYTSTSIPSGAPYKNMTGDFDFLNRPTRIARPHDLSGEAVTAIAYSGFDRAITDPDNYTTTEGRDYLGRIRSIQDAVGHTTSYAYNGADDLTQVTDFLGNSIVMTRNTLGHITQLNDPDLGVWHYTYRPNGQVRTRTDQQGQLIEYTYDTRNRLRFKIYTNEAPEEPNVGHTYDTATNGNGRIRSITKGGATTNFNSYDEMGRVTQKTVTIDGQNYVFGYGYNAAGDLTSITYPDGYSISYGYHPGSNQIRTINGTAPSLNVTLTSYSNHVKAGNIGYPSLTTIIDYYSRTGRVDTIDVPGVMLLAYTYSHAGDVATIQDTDRSLSYTYQYDRLHRLTGETATGPFYRPTDRSIALYYEGSELHAPSRVVADGLTRNLTYEDNGNLTVGYDFNQPGSPPERRLTYSAENMPLTIDYQPQGGSNTTIQFTYDGEGRRVKKDSGTDSVIYVDETYEIRNGQAVKYVFAGDLRVARIRGIQVNYFHRDHLGSSTLVTNTAGNLLESTSYEPYGLQRADCQPKLNNVPYTFTDQEWDSETGLYNYDARLYDPMLGRFLTADSVVPNWYDPQALNRYSYTLNNPLKYMDPNGHDPVAPNGISVMACHVNYTEPDTTKRIANSVFGIAYNWSPVGDIGAGVEAGVALIREPKSLDTWVQVGIATAGLLPFGDALKQIKTLQKTDNLIDASKSTKSLAQQADDLIPLNQNRNRVTLRSEKVQVEVDLSGAAHAGIETPHTKISPRNIQAPERLQPAYNTSTGKATYRQATQQDIRTVRKYLEHKNR